VHRAKTVDRFVASTHGALRLHRLPAYSPQLNLDPPSNWRIAAGRNARMPL
jgi:hypothetical protein